MNDETSYDDATTTNGDLEIFIDDAEDVIWSHCRKTTVNICFSMIPFILAYQYNGVMEHLKAKMADVNHSNLSSQTSLEITNSLCGNPCKTKNMYSKNFNHNSQWVVSCFTKVCWNYSTLSHSVWLWKLWHSQLWLGFSTRFAIFFLKFWWHLVENIILNS